MRFILVEANGETVNGEYTNLESKKKIRGKIDYQLS